MNRAALASWLLVLFPVSLYVIRGYSSQREIDNRSSFTLVFPRDVKASSVLAFMRGLAGLMGPWWRRPFGRPSAVVFETDASANGIVHRLLVPHGSAEFVTGLARSAIAGIRIVPDETSTRATSWSLAGEFRLSNHGAMLRVDQPAAAVAAILTALGPLRADERACYQYVVSPSTTGKRSRLIPALLGRGVAQSLIAALLGLNTKRPVDERELKAKLSEPTFAVSARIGVRAGSIERARQLLSRMTSVMHVTSRRETQLRRRLIPSSIAARHIVRGALPPASAPCFLNALELILVGFPIDSPAVPGLSTSGCRHLPPSPSIPSTGRVLGLANMPGAERPIALLERECLAIHVMGPSGGGKSSLLQYLTTQDFNRGRGVTVVDPKDGSLADALVERVNAGREREVIFLDVSDTEFPIGFNPLAAGDTDPELIAEQVTATFAAIYAAFWGPKTAEVMGKSILTAVKANLTLVEVPTLLINDRFRAQVTASLNDPVLEQFWQWWESQSPGERSQAIAPSLNKLRNFTDRGRIRRIIGQSKSAFSMDDVLARGMILIIKVPRGLVGTESAGLLTSLLVGDEWRAVERRAGLPPEKREPYYLYVDECQEVLRLPNSIEEMIHLSRGYSFGLCLAHQTLSQLQPRALRDSVLGGIRNKVVFQLGASDATVMAKEFGILEPDDLRGLGQFEIAALLSSGNRVAPAVTAVTQPPPPPTGRGDAVRAWSRQQFARPKAEVDREILERQQILTEVSPVQRRRRS